MILGHPLRIVAVMGRVYDTAGREISVAEAFNECQSRCTADVLALVDVLVAHGFLESREAFRILRVRSLAILDQEVARHQENAEPLESDEMDDFDDDALNVEAEKIIDEITSEADGWKAVVSLPIARAIELWAAEIARESFVKGVEAITNLNPGGEDGLE